MMEKKVEYTTKCQQKSGKGVSWAKRMKRIGRVGITKMEANDGVKGS